MDTAMEDVGRVPAEMSEVANLEPTTTPTLDGWIEGLMNCKQLSETDVQRLCEKVSLSHVLAGGRNVAEQESLQLIRSTFARILALFPTIVLLSPAPHLLLWMGSFPATNIRLLPAQ